MDIKEVMRRQYGPMPVWAWTALLASFIAGVLIFKKGKTPAGKSGGAAGNGAAGGSPVGEFNSGQSSTTTDANGNQVTTNYSASGPLTGFPGYLTNQAGPMPYSGGDVYVNYPQQNTPTQTPAPPAQQTSTGSSNLAEQLNASVFNTNGWTGDMFGAPWLMTVVNPGESWEDVVTRIYNFGAKYADITDPTAKKRIDEVTPFIRDTNKNFTGLGPNGSGPAPGSVVVYR